MIAAKEFIEPTALTFNLPEDTDVERLLADYLDPAQSLSDVVGFHNLTLTQLAAWIDHPVTRRTIEALESHADRRARTILNLARPDAAARLVDVVKADPAYHHHLPPNLIQRCRETTRKAAAAVLKAGPIAPAVPGPATPRQERNPAPPANAPRIRWTGTDAPVCCTPGGGVQVSIAGDRATVINRGVTSMRNACVIALAGAALTAYADDVQKEQIVPGQIIVKFADQPTANSLALVDAALGGNVQWYTPNHAPHAKGHPDQPHPLSFYRVANIDPAADTPALSTMLNAIPGVLWASPNGAPEPTFTPNDPMFNLLWNMDKINAEAGWDITLGTHDVVLGIIDTGCLITHEDLVDNVWVNTDEIANNGVDDDGNGFIDDTHGWDFVQNDKGVEDVFGHGTQVSGITSARINNAKGVAGLGNTRVLTAKWWHNSGSDMSVAESVYYAVDNGAHAVNLSLGCGCLMPATEDACNYAYDNNVAPIAASGNSSSGAPHYPASYPNVIAVSGIDMNDNKYVFGNWGPHISVTAPTPDITTTSNSGNTSYTNSFGGTSAATPHVAGLAGLMLSLDNSLTPDEIRALLEENAQDVGDPGFDVIFGHGRIDVGATLEAIEGSSCPADVNGDGMLNILDFIAYQNAFEAQDPDADCNADSLFNILDFICFQNVFQKGCS